MPPRAQFTCRQLNELRPDYRRAKRRGGHPGDAWSLSRRKRGCRSAGSSWTTVRRIGPLRSSRSIAHGTPWIDLVRRPAAVERSFAGKAHAVNSALERIRATGLQFDVVGNLDADVSFEADYMEFLLARFAENPKLGVAGTPFTQDGGYDSTRDSFEGQNYVAGPCQLFRDECFQDIGGYVANHAGGVDWIAVMTARMKGWTVTAFPEKRFHHHRSMGTAERGRVGDVLLRPEGLLPGGSPLWQLFRALSDH